MAERSHFQNALSNFTHETASGGAIRHLTDLGYTVAQITGQLDFPTPFERVQREVWQRLLDTEVLLQEEPGSVVRQKETYVREYDRYGKASFRKVVLEEGAERKIRWRERRLGESSRDETERLLQRKISENGVSGSYGACDFGPLRQSDPSRFQELLQTLDRSGREYVEGIPWTARRVYHRLDERMVHILLCFWEMSGGSGECYFLKTCEKLIFGEKGSEYP